MKNDKNMPLLSWQLSWQLIWQIRLPCFWKHQ